MFPPHAIVGTKGAETAPSEADVGIPKRRYSGFFGTDLDITLRERGVDTLRLVGDCTNICVLYTAADAPNLGYAVEVVEDGVTSFDEEAHRDALHELGKTLGAKLVSSWRDPAISSRSCTSTSLPLHRASLRALKRATMVGSDDNDHILRRRLIYRALRLRHRKLANARHPLTKIRIIKPVKLDRH